jgi:NADPH-dependent glutamate synthase beta subunit-like oxidoreductase
MANDSKPEGGFEDLPPSELADDTGDLHYMPAPCQVACPVGTDAPSYIAYIWEGKFEEAFEAITATNPFSSICGRVCDAPCEPACRRTASDGPLQIRNLKRFVMDKHDLCAAGYAVHVYEMTDRPGGMMAWGIPAFRLPPGVIDEDIERLTKRCPGLEVHLNTALGRDITLDELKQRHDAVLLTIGAWWGKSMNIPGEDDTRVVDGVEFLRRVNAGERPEMPETVVVIGGGDVAMDACRAALRLPGCKHVKVVYRRGPEEIPARRIELEGAVKEGIEFVYNTRQVSVTPGEDGLVLGCIKTEAGEPDADGRRRPVDLPGSEHEISCGMVIAAVGQFAACDELDRLGLMNGDRVAAGFGGMRTEDPEVFAAGDGAFGGSTIVTAMHHGQRAAYYVKAFLERREDPLPYYTPFRTRRVPVAQDTRWELLGLHEPEFFGLGQRPVEFPEIESTYDWQAARDEAARCYRCDAETGSADYIFAMARTDPADHARQGFMLGQRLEPRDNPFPEGRPATLDDLVFLPANLSRLVIDPYREACKISTEIGGRMALARPFFAAGFDDAPEDVRRGVARGLGEGGCGYIGLGPIGPAVRWLQLLPPGAAAPSAEADGLIHVVGARFEPPKAARLSDDQLLGLAVSSPAALEDAILHGLDKGFDLLLLDASGGMARPGAELSGAPGIAILRDAIRILRRIGREEEIDLVYFGGIRSGTDAAKTIALGCVAVTLGVPLALAAGGEITADQSMRFAPDHSEEERARAVANILKASAGEASMMARCTGKTNLHNLEPEDLRALTLATAEATDIPLAGTH